MNHMKFESQDMTAQNIDRIAALFPNCITEMLDEEHSTPEKKVYKRAVNFELLKQMLSPDAVDGDEAYEFTWVGKKEAIVEANKPIRKTLRPCVAESKDWDNTENLYIEGDNLEVLKLLQESYLGKVKMIYIDPPYNTGNDFIYADDFMRSQEEENEQMGMYDEDENRLFKNTDTNGRFHSDWCSMIYSRLMLARNLLTDDGAIFVSVDENEVTNAKKICEEVFGSANCVGVVSNTNNPKGRSDDKFVATAHEYILIYAKNIGALTWYGFEPTEEIVKRYNKVDNAGRRYREIDLRKTGENDLREDRPNLFYYFYYNEKTGDFYPSREESGREEYIQIKPQREDGKEGNWRWGLETAIKEIGDLIPKFMPARKVWGVMQKDYLEGRSLVKPTSSWTFKDVNSERGTEDFINLGFDKRIFPKPKPIGTLRRCIKLCSGGKTDIVIDFFSGSATTAHAVMQLNAEDGGHRKFIMVQLPEKCDETSEAYKAGYKNICEIGKERIRRAGEKIKSEIDVVHKDDYAALVQSQQSNDQKVMTGFDSLKSSGVLTEKGYTYKDKDTKDISRITYSAEDTNDFYRFHPNALDIGFRVFKLDDTNMKDVYYAPDDYDQGMLAGLESNIKDDRTDLDLLFGCLIDWGLPLSLPYKSEQLGGCTVHTYNDGDLIACFNANIPESVVKEIAQRKPLRAVFRDSSFASSPEKINVFEIFKLYMPEDAGDITKRVRVI